MDNQKFVDDASIIDYVKSINFKGKISFEAYGFRWDLGTLSLAFISNSGETTIEYKHKLISLGHIHVDNEEVIDLINQINREDKMIQITASCFGAFGSSFKIVDKTAKKKKSCLFIRRYYSC